MKQSRWFLLLNVFLISGFLAKSSFAEDLKIGLVDFPKAIDNVEAGKKAMATLKAEFEKKQKKIDEERSVIAKMVQELKQKSMVLSKEALQKKQEEIQEKDVKFRELLQKSEQEMEKRRMELTQPIVEKLRKIVKEFGDADQYTFIFEKNQSGLLYSKKPDDLTDKVIERFNKSK